MNRGKRVAAIAALMLLCVIWAWTSLRSDLIPVSPARTRVAPLTREALLLGIFSGFAAMPALVCKTRWPRNGLFRATLLIGAGLFVVPALLNEIGHGWIDDSTRVALFSLTPLFAVVFEPYLGTGSELRGGFAAAVIAVAGTFLVFPVDVPRSIASGFAFLGALMSATSVAAANCLAVRTASKEKPSFGFSFAAVAAGGAGVCIAATGAFPGHAYGHGSVPFDAWASLDLVALALLFWLMRRMSAVRMTTRFLIAPLLANLIGLALLRPHVQLQAWFGLALIALGAGWLLFAPESEPGGTGSLLGFH